MITLPCPDCAATGKISAFVDYGESRPGEFRTDIECSTCRGSGKISETIARWREAGTAHRDARVARRESIMACANRLGLNPAELSAMERGRLDPYPWITDIGDIN